MRKLLVSVALATATLAAVPAAAQYHDRGWDQSGPGHHRPAAGQLLRELDQIENRVDRSVRRGMISPREAYGLRREAGHIRNRVRWAGRNGFTRREFAELRFHVNRLERRLRIERRDRDDRRL